MACSTPFGPPLLGDYRKTQRGFAPLHAPTGDTGQRKQLRCPLFKHWRGVSCTSCPSRVLSAMMDIAIRLDSRDQRMAWLSPPVNKPGNRTCPSCGRGQSWQMISAIPWWAKWSCSRCRSVLSLDWHRHSFALLLWIPIYSALWVPVFIEHLRPPVWAACLSWLGFLAISIVIFWWFDSVNLREKHDVYPSASDKPSEST
jgi:hypothetical protein